MAGFAIQPSISVTAVRDHLNMHLHGTAQHVRSRHQNGKMAIAILQPMLKQANLHQKPRSIR